MKNMNLYNTQLDTFLRVADAGSFNKAAAEAFITPTAVIKQINLLEASLDVKLFERTHRGLILTKAGKSLYQDAKYIIHHRLAAKNRLKIQDLYGENLLLMRRGWSNYVDCLRDDIWQNHGQIHIVDFDFYNMTVFNRCENSEDVLLAIPGWANVHPLLKVIPVEWEHSIPYGLLHSPQPSAIVSRFLTAAQNAVK